MNASHDQVIERNITERDRSKVDSVAAAVEIRVHDTVLTAMENMVLPGVEMAVGSITGSSGRGQTSVVQNPDHRVFSRNIEVTPLMAASSRTDLNINQDLNDETLDSENFEDGNFPALKTNYARQTHTITKK